MPVIYRVIQKYNFPLIICEITRESPLDDSITMRELREYCKELFCNKQKLPADQNLSSRSLDFLPCDNALWEYIEQKVATMRLLTTNEFNSSLTTHNKHRKIF